MRRQPGSLCSWPRFWALSRTAARPRKKLLILFAYTGALMTGALFLVGKGTVAGGGHCLYGRNRRLLPEPTSFYDALLPSITMTDNVDMVSGFGFSLGYLGGGLLFLLNVMMYLQAAPVRHSRMRRHGSAAVVSVGGCVVGRVHPLHHFVGPGARKPALKAAGHDHHARVLSGTGARDPR
jgi:hypothetical protein